MGRDLDLKRISEMVLNQSGCIKILFWCSIILSLLLNGMIWTGKVLAESPKPLFGFRVNALDLNGTAWQRIAWPDLRSHNLPESLLFSRRLQFQSDLYLSEEISVLWHVSGSGSVSLKVNGKKLVPKPDQIFLSVGLKKGFNHVSIQWNRPPKADDLFFVLKGSLFDTNLPFFHWQIPGNGLSSFLGTVLTNIRPWKSSGFYLALCILLATFLIFLWNNSGVMRSEIISRDVLLSWSSVGMRVLSVFLLTIYFNQFLEFGFSNLTLMLVCISLLLIWFSVNKTKPQAIFYNALTKEKLFVFFSAVLITLFSNKLIYKAWIPVLNFENSDLSTHLMMVDHLQKTGTYYREATFLIYPQSLHSIMASLSDFFNLSAQNIFLTFSILFFIFFLMVQFTIGRLLFPDLKWFWFPLASVVILPGFFFQTMFGQHSFPAVVSVTIFLWALIEEYYGHFGTGLINLLAAVTIYPLFLVPFLFIYLSIHQGMMFFSRINRLKTWLTVGLSGLIMLPYVLKYMKVKEVQHQDGFQFLNQIDLFGVLGVWVACILLYGLFRANLKQSNTMMLGLTTFMGFGILYLPHILFSFLSQYYILKNLTFLIPLVSPFFAYGLFLLLTAIKNRLICLSFFMRT